MPKFVYTGTDERVFLYPRAFVVNPGDEIEAPSNPDPAWFEAAEDKKPTPRPRDEKE